MLVLLSIGFAVLLPVTLAYAEDEPWLPRADCAITKRSSDGLVPEALAALEDVGVDHRITQTINLSSAPSNYHGTDGVLNGKDFTAAVDLSVRCLNPSAIKKLLSQLAGAGFAAWYRENGKDGWKGPTHIHAVWAAEPLKPQLRRQIKSWLEGRTGLVRDVKYKYWGDDLDLLEIWSGMHPSV
jgi:hypothetical protein